MYVVNFITAPYPLPFQVNSCHSCAHFCVVEDYCDFEADPEVSCFLTEDQADDDGDWIRNTVHFLTCFRA